MIFAVTAPSCSVTLRMIFPRFCGFSCNSMLVLSSVRITLADSTIWSITSCVFTLCGNGSTVSTLANSCTTWLCGVITAPSAVWAVSFVKRNLPGVSEELFWSVESSAAFSDVILFCTVSCSGISSVTSEDCVSCAGAFSAAFVCLPSSTTNFCVDALVSSVTVWSVTTASSTDASVSCPVTASDDPALSSITLATALWNSSRLMSSAFKISFPMSLTLCSTFTNCSLHKSCGTLSAPVSSATRFARLFWFSRSWNCKPRVCIAASIASSDTPSSSFRTSFTSSVNCSNCSLTTSSDVTCFISDAIVLSLYWYFW